MHKLGYNKARVYFNIIKNINNTVKMYFIIFYLYYLFYEPNSSARI